MKTQIAEEPDTFTCANCECETPFDESLGAEVNKGKDWEDVCRDCYDEIVKTCQVCGG